MSKIGIVASCLVAVAVGACAPSSTNSKAPAKAATPVVAAPTAAATPAPKTWTLATAGVNPTWMDATVDPCQDFYDYACGGFVKTTVIPGDMSTWGPTEEVTKRNEEFLQRYLDRSAKDPGADATAKKLGDYYAACTDEAAIEALGAKPVQPLLDEIAKVSDLKTLAGAVTALHKAAIFPLFDLSAQQDFKDATKMIGALDQDGLGLPDRDYYLKNEGNQKDVRDFYRGHVGRMLTLTGMKAGENKAAVEDVMRIETAIAKISQTKVERRDPYKIYHKIDRAGVEKAAKDFPWSAYFTALGFPDLNDISVNDVGYFTKMNALMRAEKPAAWRHYLVWQVFHDKAPLLSKAFVDENFSLRQKLRGQKELEPRWKRCVRSTDYALGELLAQPYVAANFVGDSKADAVAMVQNIRGAMKAELGTLPWMDDKTRGPAGEKLDKMVYKIGYPSKWRQYDYEVVRTGYAKNAMAAESFEMQRNLRKIGKPVDRDEWDMTPPTVNAYYNPSMNEMVVPAGILQPPFFSKDFLAAVNFGETGAGTMGHELTHGFDDEGSQFDGQGNLRNWWTDETGKKFKDATKCVVEQYAKYEAIPGVHLNGELTAGENIADIGGVKLGFAALQVARKDAKDRVTVEGHSEEQLYFLGYAQSWCSKETPQFLENLARTNPHSPAKWRVNGPVTNVPAFADAFHCAANTPMRPATVCSVW